MFVIHASARVIGAITVLVVIRGEKVADEVKEEIHVNAQVCHKTKARPMYVDAEACAQWYRP